MSIITVFINNVATTKTSTLSLHDALPIYEGLDKAPFRGRAVEEDRNVLDCEQPGHSRHGRRVSNVVHRHECRHERVDRKSTRLNSSHRCISYAVFCLKKKKRRIELTNSRR